VGGVWKTEKREKLKKGPKLQKVNTIPYVPFFKLTNIFETGENFKNPVK